ncbi:hypothetical protein FACS1894198_1270 [Clostridia bacterium]|nr:hypothetical protein FACS1894198_1270 [Clostridia bacterium]
MARLLAAKRKAAAATSIFGSEIQQREAERAAAGTQPTIQKALQLMDQLPPLPRHSFGQAWWDASIPTPSPLHFGQPPRGYLQAGEAYVERDGDSVLLSAEGRNRFATRDVDQNEQQNDSAMGQNEQQAIPERVAVNPLPTQTQVESTSAGALLPNSLSESIDSSATDLVLTDSALPDLIF